LDGLVIACLIAAALVFAGILALPPTPEKGLWERQGSNPHALQVCRDVFGLAEQQPEQLHKCLDRETLLPTDHATIDVRIDR
jgi:hypothetical protein